MPSTVPSPDTSLSLSQRLAFQQAQRSPQSPPTCSGDAYEYLRRHNIPSRVEEMFSGVLGTMPEDPLQYIVDRLRRRSGPSSGASRSGHRAGSGATKPASPLGPPRTGAGAESAPPGQDGAPPATAEAPAPHEPHTPLQSGGLTASPPAEEGLHTSLDSASRANAFGVRPSSAAMVVPPWPSRRSSRNGTPYTGMTSFRLGGGVGEALYSSTGGMSLDRDESSRSDLSAISLASVDMQEFIQDFRTAKVQCVGCEAKLVTVEELSDILQQVNVPLPEISIISDLFDEVKVLGELRYPHSAEDGVTDKNASPDAASANAEGRERVYFDAFLSRMALAIQGRYPTELVRGTYYAMMESAMRRRRSAADATQQKQSKPSVKGNVDGALGGSLDSVTGRSLHLATKSACRHGSGSGSASGGSGGTGGGIASGGDAASALCTRGASAVPQALPSSSAYRAAPSDTTDSTQFSTLLNGVPLAICVEEGIWQGLGIPASKSEVVHVLRALGIPPDDDYEFHVNDFLRLVSGLTGQGSLGGSEKASLWLPFTKENSTLPQGRASRDDSI